jgi:tetratricopeptide (TPR) repeat protein
VTPLDKYEYNLKLDQMKIYVAEGNYEGAAEIADSINWNKIKNVNALIKAGEVYEKVERYEDARDILLNAYDRSPIGRTIIYRLAEVAIKMKDYVGAQEYYDEFVDIAPHDNQRYILKYHIKKFQGASTDELIPILEEFKEKEYTEEWAFELAYLYHKAGIIDKCIDACDELILWFGDGPYVERALELKMLYQPLTKAQEEKYRQFHHEKEGKTVIGPAEMERAGEYIHDTVAIPPISLNPSRFNTTNLQEEIVKGMQQIMEATKKETVVGTMDNIKKIAEEIPYLQLPTEEELAANSLPFTLSP